MMIQILSFLLLGTLLECQSSPEQRVSSGLEGRHQEGKFRGYQERKMDADESPEVFPVAEPKNIRLSHRRGFSFDNDQDYLNDAYRQRRNEAENIVTVDPPDAINIHPGPEERVSEEPRRY